MLAIQEESGSVPFALDMLNTGAISAILRPQGGIGLRRFAPLVLVLFAVFAGFFATAQQAGADTGIPASGASGATADLAAQVPPGSTAVPPPTAANSVPEAPVDPAQPVAQDAATAQAATADAAAAQPQQSNGIGTTRTDSSGDESVSQQNDLGVVGAAVNAAATNQAADSGAPTADDAPGEVGQQATSDQAANAAAAAVQPQQSNVVIIIRINSPGDDVVSQTNVVSVVAVGANQSSTAQGSEPPTASPSGATDPIGASAQGTDGQATQSPSAAQAQQQQQQGQPAQVPGAVQHPAHSSLALQLRRPAPSALAILLSSASSNASWTAPKSQGGSPTTSANRLRRGGDRGRSGASASRTLASLHSVGPSGNSTPLAKTRGAARSTGAHDSAAGATLEAVRDHLGSLFSRTRLAPPSQIAANAASGGPNFALATLAALLVGLLGWGALTWLPSARGSPWRGARG
jgi:hypothetical protein